MTCDKMVQTMAKHDKIFTVTILRDMFVTRTNDISASVEFSIRFHSEMFHAKPPKIIFPKRTIRGRPWVTL